MPLNARPTEMLDEMTAWRRDFHAHPEIGNEEHRTSALIAERLASWGIEVALGLARPGVQLKRRIVKQGERLGAVKVVGQAGLQLAQAARG